MRTPSISASRCPVSRFPRRATLAALGAVTLLTAAGARRSATAEAPGQLRIGGTGMALATMRHIAEAFTAGQPGIVVEVLPSLGSSGGLAAVVAGVIDLAISARPLTEAEKAKGLRSVPYASTPIAFASHPSNRHRNITLVQLTAILAGTLTVWPDATPIRLVRREPSDADWNTLRALSTEVAGAVEIALHRPGLVTVATDQENADALERLPGSFGAISIGQSRAEQRQLRVLALEGVQPDSDGVASGRYRLSRTLRAAWSEPPGPELAAFLDFLWSQPANDVLTRLGHLPASRAGAS